MKKKQRIAIAAVLLTAAALTVVVTVWSRSGADPFKRRTSLCR